MANIKSQIKRNKQNEKARQRNQAVKSRLKTSVRKFRELAETRNRADALLHATEKSVKDLGDKVTGEERAAIEAAISDLRGVLKGDDQSAIEHKAEALAKASAPVVQRAYQAEGAPASADAPKAGADAGKDDVLDAEFEEIKDKDGKPH